MKNLTACLAVFSLLGVSWVAAQTPVAMRVEIEPLGAVGEDTRVAVVVQIAPEDRARIGHSAMMRTDLSGADQPDQGQLWAVRVESDGSARIEVVWPPGEHDLRVDIESPSGQESGLWVGRVRIPRYGPQGSTEAVVPASPTPEPEPIIEPEAAAAAAAIAAAPTRALPPPPAKISLEPFVVGGEPDAGVEAGTEVTPAPARTPEPAPEEPPPTSTVRAEAPSATPTPVVETEAAELTVTPEPTSPPSPTPTPAPLVAPLRAKTPSTATTSGRTGEPQPPAAEIAEASAELVAAFEAWEIAVTGTRDLTVVVTQNGDPVRGLRTEDLRLRVGGASVPIEDVGDVDAAPLFLGIAVDLSPVMAGEWAHIRRELAPLVRRVGGGRGRIFVAPATAGSRWPVASSDLGESSASISDADLASLITSSLARFEGQRGRTFLLVVTDGHGESSKTAWKEAVQAAEEAGVPVLVIALWNADFSQRVRRNLQRITSASGGKLFLVQGASQLGGVVGRYGGILDAGVALRFQVPAGTKGAPQAVSVEPTDSSLQVRSPEKIR